MRTIKIAAVRQEFLGIHVSPGEAGRYKVTDRQMYRKMDRQITVKSPGEAGRYREMNRQMFRKRTDR